MPDKKKTTPPAEGHFVQTSSNKFCLRGNKSKQVYGQIAHSGELTISGLFDCRGTQPVDDDGGCPVWVDEVLEKHPEIKMLALTYERGGVVYSRMSKPVEANDEVDPKRHREIVDELNTESNAF